MRNNFTKRLDIISLNSVDTAVSQEVYWDSCLLFSPLFLYPLTSYESDHSLFPRFHLPYTEPSPRQLLKSKLALLYNERDLSVWAGPFLVFGRKLPTIID